MYKSKSAAMLRGAMKRANLSPRVTSAKLAKLVERPLNAKITDDELIEFNSLTKPKSVLLNELRPVIKRLSGQEAVHISTHLNSEGWKTAQGRRWDARLVTLLLDFLSDKPVARIRRMKPVKPLKSPVVDVARDEAPEALGPASREALARRLGALGRIKGS